MKIYFIVRYSNDNKDSLSILESIKSERLSVESIIISKFFHIYLLRFISFFSQHFADWSTWYHSFVLVSSKLNFKIILSLKLKLII